MILDTTFVSDLLHEREAGQRGRATGFLAAHRSERLLITVITVGEIAAMYADTQDARQVLSHYRQLRLTPEIAFTAAIVDRELIAVGARLGENDNWIAGFCRYYGQPVVSRDAAFGRVRNLRRLVY